jgi:hypothetical protein
MTIDPDHELHVAAMLVEALLRRLGGRATISFEEFQSMLETPGWIDFMRDPKTKTMSLYYTPYGEEVDQ